MSRTVIVLSWLALTAAVAHFVFTATKDGTSIVVEYYPDNTVASISSVDTAGKRHGETRFYSNTGKLWSIVQFYRNSAVSHKTFYPNGDLRSETIEQPDYTITEKNYPEPVAPDAASSTRLADDR